MKIKSRNLLTTILAVFCTVALALGVSFVLPKVENLSANAAGGIYDDANQTFVESELNALAQATGQYKNLNELVKDVKSGTTLKANDFGSYVVSFGGMDWWPVYLTNAGDKTVLTLWLKESIGDYTWSDGSQSVGAADPRSNNYSTSWLHAAINAGNTSAGCYYYYPNLNNGVCTQYANSSRSPVAPIEPTNFNTFQDFVSGGKYADVILPAGTVAFGSNRNDTPGYSESGYSSEWAADNLFLPSFQEVMSGGDWKCTATQWGSSNIWLRTGLMTNYQNAYTFCAGSFTGPGVAAVVGVRPAIHLDVGLLVVGPKDVEVVYNGNAQTIANVDEDDKTWYDSTIMDLTYPSNTDDMKVAGTYSVKVELNAQAIADGLKFVGKPDGAKGETESIRYFDFKIKPKPISAPTVQNSTQTYKAAEYEFGLSGYDKDIMSVPSGGYVSNNGSTITWDSSAEKFKAADASTYTVKFHLDSQNYVWDVGNGTTADQSKTITINKKEISITTTPAANTSPSWGLGETASIAVTASSGITAANYVPDFVLNMYYIKDGDTANPLTTGIDSSAMTLDVSQIESSGEYKLCIELTSATANKNYSINNDKFEMPFSIGSGAVDTSVINWQYKEGTGNAADLFDASGVQEVLRYKKDGNDTVKYYILANINTSGSYLSIDNSYSSNGYTNGLMTINSNGATVQYADKVGTYKTRVVLNTDSDHVFDDDHKLDTDGLKGWYEIEWEISKGKIDQDYLDNLNENLQYRVAGGAWQTYDPDNPPAYGSGTIEIRFNPAKYPDGVSNAEITVNDKNTAIGTYTAQVKFTIDTNNYETITTQSFQWRIGAKQIEVDWTSENWTDASGDNVLDDYGVPYQIKVLNIDDDLKQYVEYQYYVANSDLSMGSYVGTNEIGLEALTSAPYNASSVNPIYVYVKAVIKSGVDQYELKDDSGDDCTLLFRLGATNTLVTVTQNAKEMVYGESGFNSTILTLIASDTNAALGTNFIEGIYVYDPQGNELGLLSGFDGTTATAGTYTIKIVLTEAGNDTYTLTPGAKYTFTVKPKAIPVPTLSDIVFKNDFVDLRDYLGGSWNEYQSIIKLGGTYDGVKNVGTYSVTLTLTDENYCWDYGTSATPAKATVKYSLTDNVVWSGDETVASYDWKIAPYVLKASSWNLGGKEGAVYNIPANLTEGLDVDINYLYHTDKTSNPLGNGESLEAGKTYFVKAQLIGADASNFVFEDSNATTSDFATYKIPQSGAAAFMNSVKDFMTKTWLGLPVWAWFLIALALLILLIIIIVVACKRRKSKEEREEIKARKEEERQRREEERQMQREKLEAERELAKAKQEAELEKIRAQAGIGMAGAGMATMAMQQPVQQVQQPVQAVQPQNDMNAQMLAEMRAQIAELRAENRAAQSQAQQQMSMPPMPQYIQQPVQMPMPQYMPMPQPSADGGALARLEAQINAMQAEQRAHYDAEQRAELAAMRAEQHVDRESRNSAELAAMREQLRGGYNGIPDYSVPHGQQTYAPQTNAMDMLGALVVAALKNIATGDKPEPTAAIPQNVEESTQNSPAQYPSDAVITTTTTVDTTKTKPVARNRNEDSNFDIDGFYDNADF